jgi:hypothetical protein
MFIIEDFINTLNICIYILELTNMVTTFLKEAFYFIFTIKTGNKGLGIGAHDYNPSYLGGELRGCRLKTSLSKEVSRTLSQRTRWVWWCLPGFLVTWEAEVGGSKSEDSRRQTCETLFEK